jgi:hypothetical protein
VKGGHGVKATSPTPIIDKRLRHRILDDGFCDVCSCRKAHGEFEKIQRSTRVARSKGGEIVYHFRVKNGRPRGAWTFQLEGALKYCLDVTDGQGLEKESAAS